MSGAMSERSVAVSFSRTDLSMRPYCAHIARQTELVVSRTTVSVHGEVGAVTLWAVASDDAVTTDTSNAERESRNSRGIRLISGMHTTYCALGRMSCTDLTIANDAAIDQL